MKKTIISTLDQNTADASCVRMYRQPDIAREQLAVTRAAMLNDVADYLHEWHISLPVERLLSFVTDTFSLYATIERDRARTDRTSDAHETLPSFETLSDQLFTIADIINFIVRLGEKQDAINTVSEALILQSEPEGHTFVK